MNCNSLYPKKIQKLSSHQTAQQNYNQKTVLKRDRASATHDSGNRLRKFRFFRGQSRVTFSIPGRESRFHAVPTHRRGKNRIPLSAKGERLAPFSQFSRVVFSRALKAGMAR